MPGQRTLPANLRASYTEAPDRIAITLQHAGQDDISLTYKSLLDGANGFAKTYAREGIQPGEVVVLILQHSQELVLSFWGAVLHGSIPSIMPFLTEKLSPERYRADLQALIETTRPAAIVTYPEFETEVRDALLPDSSVRMVIITNEIESASPPDFNRLPSFSRSPSDVVLLQHSSGTTGLQKGVALSHQAVLNQLDAYGQALHLDDDDVIVSWLPLYHDMGLIASFLLPMLTRTPLVLMSPFDWVRAPYHLMGSVSQYRGTLTWMPNFAYNFCAQKIRPRHLEGVDLSSWRAIINCSEPVKVESHRIFQQAFEPYGLRETTLQTSYAMAENVFAVTQSPMGKNPVVEKIDRKAFITERVVNSPVDGQPDVEMLSSGRVVSNTNIRILDEKGHDLPERMIGEIALQSNCMLTGYYNRPNVTKQAFLDGWFLTGDYGYISNGEVFVTGRKKDILIVGGKNVYPQDLEMLAYEVEGVYPGRAVAFSMFDEKAGTEEVVLVAEADGIKSDAKQELADRIRQHVTQNSAIALRYVHIVNSQWILKTSSGKPARLANRDKYLSETARN